MQGKMGERAKSKNQRMVADRLDFKQTNKNACWHKAQQAFCSKNLN